MVRIARWIQRDFLRGPMALMIVPVVGVGMGVGLGLIRFRGSECTVGWGSGGGHC